MSGQWSETEKQPDIAISVHPELVSRRIGSHAWKARAEEFDRLVESSSCNLTHSRRFTVRRAVASTLFGEGQLDEVCLLVDASEAEVVFVDHPLTPVQQRNLEKAWKAKVVDRTGLILEIFASRARTREGVLQVELASLNYQLGRLVRSWTHLERQRGGFGFMGGPGERQIELDRRMIRGKIKSLEKDLEKVRQMRATQRAGRKKRDIPTAALVGYTNAGKSTLFNRLTESGVYAADQLFATLDPTLRKLELADGLQLMLSDTVGFVQELPHELVDAFRATLEEVVEADLILHVRDAADAMLVEQGKMVEETLEQLGLTGDLSPPVVEVMNKKDLVPGLESYRADTAQGSRIALSATTGDGVDDLIELLTEWLQRDMHELSLTLDASDGRTLAFCYQKGNVLSRMDDGTTINIVVRMSASDAGRFIQSESIDRLK